MPTPSVARLICAVRALVGPFGLLRVRAETAAYIEIWTRRIVAVGRLGHRLRQCRAAARPASRRLCGAAAAGDAGRCICFIVVIILQCRRQVADPIRAPRAAKVSPRGRAIASRPGGTILAIALDLALWGVWALNIRNGYCAAAAIFRRHHRGGADGAAATDRGAEPDRSRLLDQPGTAAALSRPRSPRQPLSAAAAPGRRRHHRRHRLRRACWKSGASMRVVWFYGGQIGSRLLSAFATIAHCSAALRRRSGRPATR